MNRIRGSLTAKIIAWILFFSGIAGTLFFGAIMVVGVTEDFFQIPYEEEKERILRNINENYSLKAFQEKEFAQNASNLAELGFRYGIIENKNQDLREMDLNNPDTYIQSNFFMEGFKQEINAEDLFYCQIFQYSSGSRNGNISMNYRGTYKEYMQDREAIQKINEADGWGNKNTAELPESYEDMIVYNPDGRTSYYHTEEGNTKEWLGLYADKICYDTSGGIFYYHAEGEYYPVQNICLTYETDQKTYQYNYVYDFEKKAYKYMDTSVIGEAEFEETTIDERFQEEVEENPEQNMLAQENETELGSEIKSESETKLESEMESESETESVNETETETSTGERTIQQILTGEGKKGFVTFQQLDNTDFSYNNWGEILLDDIRYLQAEELTFINSKNISKQEFSDATEYYLNENYTLMLSTPVERNVYWVVSLISENVTEGFNQGGYAQEFLLIDILYYFGESALVGLVLFGILAFAAFVFLMAAAGHRKYREEIVLLPFPDKIPFDIWTVAVFLVAAGLVVMLRLIIRLNMEDLVLILSMVAIVLLVGAGIALWYLLGFSVRIKYGKWWRNTICYIVLKWINVRIRGFCSLISQNIGILWKLLGVYGILSFVEWILLLAIWSQNEVLFLWIIEKAVVLLLLVLLVLQMRDLQEGSRHLAQGDLQYCINTDKMFWECKKHGENLNQIGEGMSKAVEERMKSERLKTELITNVSHDIKTPLTSIINYVDLLQKEELHNEKAAEYLEVLERQSSKLKKLIEDLVEASKASSGNISVVKEELDVGVFLIQTVGEFEEKLSAAGLELIINKPEETFYILADGRHLWRVVDNLMNNICKYAQPHSRVYVNLGTQSEYVEITFRNMSKFPLNISSDELTERFVRGDKSRNTEGHGLGLSIAKSLVEIMGGELQIVIDGDLFKVILQFQRKVHFDREKNI